jgi:hypothetical protein
MKTFRCLIVVTLFLVFTPLLRAGEEAEALCQKGMDSFLQGDYDQAILWAAKSLQVEPGYKKAQDLLSVLVVEKERGSQTEIWLGDKARMTQVPGMVPTPDLSDIRHDIQGLGVRVTTLEKRTQTSQLERRIQIITDMMQKEAKDNYRDFKASQDLSLEKIERLAKGQGAMGLSLFWLFVLVALSLVLSVWNLIRKKPEAPRLSIEK